MKTSVQSWLLVTAQLVCIGFIILTGSLFVHGGALLFLELAGLTLGAWAMWTIGLRQVRIQPVPAGNARLITGGPYRYVRHPMYTAVLVVTGVLVIDYCSVARLIAWGFLLGVLLVKVNFEEHHLRKKFKDYPAYQRRTKRLVPFLYILTVLVAPRVLHADEWNDYRVIMWVGDSAYKQPDKFPLFIQRLREMGVTTGMVHGDADPQPWLDAQFPYYVENIVNRGLCLKWNSKVRDWDKFINGWMKTRDPAALVREYCLDDPQWQDWARNQMRQIVRKHTKNHPLAYNIRDELSITMSACPFDYCFCPKTLANFRTWLKTQYRDLAALNQQWETDFKSWDEVLPFTTDQIKARMATGERMPQGKPDWQALVRLKFDGTPVTRWNFSPWCDFRTYMDISLARELGALRQVAHEIDPHTPVGIEGTQMPDAFGGYDLARLSRVLDWVEPYDIGNARAIFGSFMSGRPIVSTVSDPKTARRQLWHLLLEGDRGCIIWWSEDCIDWKSDDLALTPKAKALIPVFKELTSPLAHLFLRAQREYDPIFIRYSQPAIQVDWLLESIEDGRTWPRRFSSYEAEHNHQVKQRAECLRSFQRLGFTPQFTTNANSIVTDPITAAFDEHGRLRRQPTPMTETWEAYATRITGNLHAPVTLNADAITYRYRLGKARLLAFQSLAGSGETEARLAGIGHVYDLRRQAYLGHTDRFTFQRDPDLPAFFAVLPEYVAPEKVLHALEQP